MSVPLADGKIPAFAHQPSQYQLALAITLVRSKPSVLSILDYVLLLRRCISSHDQASTTSASHSQSYRLDTSKYWRLLYQKSIAHEEDLRNQICDLERKLSSQSSWLVDDGSLQDGSANSRKRKPAEPIGKSTRRNKNTKIVEALAMDEALLYNLKDEANHSDTTLAQRLLSIPSLTANSVSKTLLKHVFTIGSITQQVLPLSDNDTLVTALIQGCEAFRSCLSSHCDKLNLAVLSDSTTLREEANERFFHGLSRVLRVFSQGFSKLATMSLRPLSSIGTIIYHLISLLRHILTRIKSTSRQTTVSSPPNLPPPNSRKARKKTPSSTKSSPNPSCPQLKTLTNLAYTFLTAFQPPSTTHPQHKKPYTDLYEGALHVVLSRTGELLYTTTFSRPRGPTVADEIAMSLNALRIPTTAATMQTSATDTTYTEEICAARLEARHLLPLLRHLLANTAISAYPSRTPDAPLLHASGNGARSDTTADSSADILASPFRRLQNTLICGIWGLPDADGEDGAAGIFAPVLQAPLDGSVVPLTGESEEVEDKWFEEQIWGLVGWDVLTAGYVHIP